MIIHICTSISRVSVAEGCQHCPLRAHCGQRRHEDDDAMALTIFSSFRRSATKFHGSRMSKLVRRRLGQRRRDDMKMDAPARANLTDLHACFEGRERGTDGRGGMGRRGGLFQCFVVSRGVSKPLNGRCRLGQGRLSVENPRATAHLDPLSSTYAICNMQMALYL